MNYEITETPAITIGTINADMITLLGVLAPYGDHGMLTNNINDIGIELSTLWANKLINIVRDESLGSAPNPCTTVFVPEYGKVTITQAGRDFYTEAMKGVSSLPLFNHQRAGLTEIVKPEKQPDEIPF